MNNVQNQNGKLLEEMLAGSNSDGVKTTLKSLRDFQNGHSPFASSWKASCYSAAVESIINGSIHKGVTFKLVGCQFKVFGHLGMFSDSN